ncbi:MAG TPA: UDP-N-acetylmuramate dehydrogenase [Acidobacteriaceae bacterium]|nr:UDP-N-acetylmuramate dehydrogenase [Acidobacteriaceae bacterium]
MTVQEQVALAPFTTFRVGGPARYFVEADDELDLWEAFHWAEDSGLRFEVLGGGSNLLVADAGFDGLVLHTRMRGVERRGDVFDVAAGESWDELVHQTIAAGYAGLECLAGIPGTVGASPVQNIGAYGQEVAQTIESVRALDRTTGAFVDLSAAACGFRYRRSIFNGEARGRYAITRVRFRLRAGGKPFLGYADLQRWFAGRAEEPCLAEVAEAVRAIRRGKGMVLIEGDPDTWSAGSYFKNPVVAAEVVDRVAAAAGAALEAVPKWAAGEGCVKLSAAWLLERAGFGRAFRLGPAGLSTKHALALTNRGGATCADLLRLEETIRFGVRERFGVVLEREPVLLG